jgi:hypothetical protein
MSSNFVIIGLPASGKTTFLAALWHLVEAGEATSRLSLDSYEGDLTYLNRIAEAWRNFQKVPRTSQVGDVNVTIHLVNRQTGVKGAAFFPDLAGETFDGQVESRRCRPEFVEAVAQDDGILFFISADVKSDSMSVVELNSMLPHDAMVGVNAGIEQESKPETSAPAPMPEWTPKLIPTQVRAVQLLSDFLRPPFEQRLRRLAVIISAWDLTDGMNLEPQAWLSKNMPLFSQFLQTNSASFAHQVYGVSAQGIKLEDKTAVHEAAQLVSSRRIRVIGPNENGHDLTAPLVWLMSKE